MQETLSRQQIEDVLQQFADAMSVEIKKINARLDECERLLKQTKTEVSAQPKVEPVTPIHPLQQPKPESQGPVQQQPRPAQQGPSLSHGSVDLNKVFYCGK